MIIFDISNILQLYVLNGAMLSLDILAFLLADEKDVFLCPVPGYNSYFQAGKQRWNIEIISVPFDFEIKVKLFSEMLSLEIFVIKLGLKKLYSYTIYIHTTYSIFFSRKWKQHSISSWKLWKEYLQSKKLLGKMCVPLFSIILTIL